MNPNLFYKEIFNRLPFTNRDKWDWTNGVFFMHHTNGTEQYSTILRVHRLMLNINLRNREEGIEIDYTKFNSRD